MPLSEQEFNAISDKVAQSAPSGLSEAQFDALVDAEVQKASSGGQAPSSPLVEHMGTRLAGGYETSDYKKADSPIMGMLRSFAHPETLGEMAAYALPSGIGFAAAEGARSSVPGAIADAGTAIKGTLRRIPGISSIMDNFRDARTARTELPKLAQSARLVKTPMKLEDQIRQAVMDVLKSDTANAPAEAVGGAARPLPNKISPFDPRIANVDPQTKIPGMTASLPDATGTTVIRRPLEQNALLDELRRRGLLAE